MESFIIEVDFGMGLPRPSKNFEETQEEMNRWAAIQVKALFGGILLAGFFFLAFKPAAYSADTGFSDPFEAVARVAESTLPSVVTLEVTVPENHPAATILGTKRVGTGVVVSSSGHILTASYIVMGGRQIEVTLTDGRTLPGKVHKIDYSSGLAVLKIETTGLSPALLGKSQDLRIGQMAITIGSRGGADRVVHHGIVSAVRPFTAPWEFIVERAVYTTAMTSGFFGGTPLLDAQGRVVGIISLNMSEDRGMGLAIPIDLFTSVRQDLLDLRPDSRRLSPWLGVQTVFVEGELLVRRVTSNGPAGVSGVLPKDVIQEIDGKPVKSQEHFYRAVWRHRIGEPIQLTIKRGEEVLGFQVPGGNREEFFR
jgi:S1-C subfamily serine protease